MNFARDVVDAAPATAPALIEIARDGSRRVWTFGEVAERSTRLAGTFAAHGVRPGDVVMTLIGNRPEWVIAMVACLRIGAVVLPCMEQLRAKDLRHRFDTARPRLVVADERNRGELKAAMRDRTGIDVLLVPDEALYASAPAPAPDLEPDRDCLVTFTSGTSGEPKGVVHGQRYLTGQRLQAERWLGARPGDIVWCTAATGWSKSARNAFIAPWLCGATAVLHDARFDPAERMAIVERECVNVLCMAPTEYRVIAKRTELRPSAHLRELVAAGEALNPEVTHTFRDALGVPVRDGYGQTETGQLTGVAPGAEVPDGSMGPALPGIRAWIDGGELVVDPATVPTFFLRYLGDERAHTGPWRTGDRVEVDSHGCFTFVGRADDIIISAGYRIGPYEVESALIAHATVAEAAVVSAPDDERGSVVRAVVVLRDGHMPSDALVRELQSHVKAETAPYKYPRIVDFVPALPKTDSGKIQRALLR